MYYVIRVGAFLPQSTESSSSITFKMSLAENLFEFYSIVSEIIFAWRNYIKTSVRYST